METHILVVEDDAEIREGVAIYLKNQGYTVHGAANGAQGLELARQLPIHLAVVDVMMPVMDGITMVMKLRDEGCEFPVIMLSAKSEDIDKITGLNIGADDYVTKPFSVKELAARVRAVIRRQEYLAAPDSQTLTVCGISIDASRRHVLKNGEPVELTQREFDLLYTLMKTPGRVYTREMLLDTVWKVDFFGDTRTVDVHVRYLRQKLEDEPDHPKRILTVRGVGYRFAEEES